MSFLCSHWIWFRSFIFMILIETNYWIKNIGRNKMIESTVRLSWNQFESKLDHYRNNEKYNAVKLNICNRNYGNFFSFIHLNYWVNLLLFFSSSFFLIHYLNLFQYILFINILFKSSSPSSSKKKSQSILFLNLMDFHEKVKK